MYHRLIRHFPSELGLVYLWPENQEIFSLLEMYIKMKVIFTYLPAEGAVMQVCSCRTWWTKHSQTRPTCQIPLMRVNSRFPFALNSLTSRLISSWFFYYLLLASMSVSWRLCTTFELHWDSMKAEIFQRHFFPSSFKGTMLAETFMVNR